MTAGVDGGSRAIGNNTAISSKTVGVSCPPGVGVLGGGRTVPTSETSVSRALLPVSLLVRWGVLGVLGVDSIKRIRAHTRTRALAIVGAGPRTPRTPQIPNNRTGGSGSLPPFSGWASVLPPTQDRIGHPGQSEVVPRGRC